MAFASGAALQRVGQTGLVALLAVEVGRSPLLWSRAYRRLGDLTYGLYLYAYPVGAFATARFFTGANFWPVALGSADATLGMAALSWRFVERRALGLARLPPLIRTFYDLRGSRADPTLDQPQKDDMTRST